MVARPDVMSAFREAFGYFNTFGGNPVSAAAALATLAVMQEEGLQENARRQGARLLDGLRELQKKHAVIGDVRGIGLFVGVELIKDPASRQEGTKIASYVKDRMRAKRILLGSEGPNDNILKIRPPLTITGEDVEMLLTTLDQILTELD